jgi:Tfp pilus assembly protein PilO
MSHDPIDATPPLRQRLLDPRILRPLILSTLVGIIAAGGVEYVAVSPILANRDDLLAARNALAMANRENEATLVGYEEFLEKKADVDRRFEIATAAVPTDAELATVLESIRSLAVDARMQLSSFTPEPVKSRGSTALEQRRVSVLVRGGYDQLKTFLAQLGSFPRMLTVENVHIKPSTLPEFTVEAAITITCYAKPVPAAAR